MPIRTLVSHVDSLIPRQRAEIAPGAVHVPEWLGFQRQRELVTACREWSRPPAGMRATTLPGGGVMSVRTVCLGWHWHPYRYTRTAPDGSVVTPFPDWLGDLAREAVSMAYQQPATDYQPDTALINYYDKLARMGMHQDRDEHSREPVVSLSLGDSCVFRFGNPENRKRPWTDVELCSGDLFVFGGSSRMAFHGVPKTLPGTGNPDIGLRAGRLNITIRVSGLG